MNKIPCGPCVYYAAILYCLLPFRPKFANHLTSSSTVLRPKMIVRFVKSTPIYIKQNLFQNRKRGGSIACTRNCKNIIP